jgi:hypothetical protein
MSEIVSESLSRALTTAFSAPGFACVEAPATGSAKKLPPQDIPRRIVEAVDLAVCCSLVLPPYRYQPCAAVLQENGRYTIDGLSSLFGGSWLPDTFNVPAEELRLWRARFLICRDALYHALVTRDYQYASFLGSLHHYPTRCALIGMFFPEGVMLPDEGSELARELAAKAPPYRFADGSIAVEVSERP